MRYAIIGDVHSNLEALEAVIKACREEGARTIVCTGDIVGYGANPNECIDLLIKERAVCIAGNHDWAVCGKLDYAYFNEYGQKAVVWTQSHLTEAGKNFLSALYGISKGICGIRST